MSLRDDIKALALDFSDQLMEALLSCTVEELAGSARPARPALPPKKHRKVEVVVVGKSKTRYLPPHHRAPMLPPPSKSEVEPGDD